MTVDALTTLDWLTDQKRYMAGTPLASQSVTLLREILGRSLDADGIALCLRVVRAALFATTELAPTSLAPLAHRVVFGKLRRSLWYTLLDLAGRAADGDAEPLLSETALANLIAIETQDVVVAPPVDRLRSLALVYLGFSWRVSAIDLGIDTRQAGAAALVGGGAPMGGIVGGEGSAIHEFAANIGDGVATAIVLTHGLNTQDVAVLVRQAAAPYNVVYPDVAITSVNTITLTFTTAPTSGQFRVVVLAA